MFHFRRALAALSAALLLGGALTGCGTAEPQVTETTAAQFSVELPLVELAERSEYIVSGTITAASDPFRVEAATGETSIFTDYTITVDTVFKGDEAETLTLRMQGGELDGERVVPTPDFGVAVDKEFLFFLYQPGAGYFNTDESYLVPTGGGMGLFVRTGEADAYQNALNDGLAAAGLPTLVGTDATYDPASTAENDQAGWDALLADGALTQEQYDAIVAQADVYATRVAAGEG